MLAFYLLCSYLNKKENGQLQMNLKVKAKGAIFIFVPTVMHCRAPIKNVSIINLSVGSKKGVKHKVFFRGRSRLALEGDANL